jgi:hypothetical protein
VKGRAAEGATRSNTETQGTGRSDKKKDEGAGRYKEVKSIRFGGKRTTRWVRANRGGEETELQGILTKGTVNGCKRPVFTRNDVFRGDKEDGSNETLSGRHTKADDSIKTLTKTNATG